MKRKGWVSGFVCFFLFSVLGIQIPTLAQNVLPGFSSGILDRNDDGSTGLTPIGFNINFFGATYDHLYVNNNGNVTFTGPLWTFDPAGLDLSSTAVIAAFFGDVDTRSAPSGIVTYGPGTFLSRSAFGATWNQVGYYSHGTDKLNTFQIVLVDRSDIAAGDFDIYLRYDQIQWDTSATHDTVASRVGYSNGTDTSYEAPGSGVVGAQVDGGPQSLVTRRILLFQVRSGVVIVVDPNLIKIIRLRPFVNFSRTESSHALAAGLDAAPNGLLPRILNDILDPDVMAAMLESLVPYEAALPTQILFDGFQRAHSAFTTAQPVKAPTDKPGVNERLWISPFGAYVEEDSRSSRPGFSYGSAGLLAGADFGCTPNGRFGVAAGFEQSNFDLDSDQGGDGDLQSLLVGVYGRCQIRAFEFESSLLGGFHQLDVNRKSPLGRNSGDTDGYSISGQFGVGRALELNRWLALRPHLRALYSYLYINDYQEGGTMSTALTLASQDEQSLKTDLGLAANFSPLKAYPGVVFSVLVGYLREHLYDEHKLEASFTETPGSDFSLQTSTSARDVGYAGISALLPLRKDITLGLDARTLLSQTTEQYTGQATVTWWW